MRKHYEPSGKYSALSLLYFALASFLILPILGLIYAYCIWYIPFIYINFFITLGFGFGTGFIITFFAIKLGKIRNQLIASALGILGGLIALYFHWSVWVDLVINAGENYGSDRLGFTVSNIQFLQVFKLATNPAVLFNLIGEINKSGTWGLGSIPVSGIFLALIWIAEAVIVIGVSFRMTRIASKIPFCEINNDWFKEHKIPELNFIADKDHILSSIENDDESHFHSLTKAQNKAADSHSVFTVFSSRNNEYYLTLENKTAKLNSKGKTEFDSDEIVKYVAIKAPSAKALLGK
jgi:hypothetical protein